LAKLRSFAATRTHPIGGNFDTAPRAEYSTSREYNTLPSYTSSFLVIGEHFEFAIKWIL
jgi:hypothetical protein